MGRRRKARELALQSLYELELPDNDPASVLTGQARRRGSSPESQSYARLLVDWVREDGASLDQAIAKHLEHWDLSRVSLVCRIVLRIALVEGRRVRDLPIAVILDEAVELARKYDSEEAGGFVNGVLEGLLLAERGRGEELTGA